VTSASLAYRRDIAARGQTFGERDNGWLLVATMLESAAGTTGAPRRRLIRAAAKQARRLLGTARLRRMAAFHWNGTATSPFDAILLLIYTVEAADALRLASSMVRNALAAMDDASIVQRGRYLSLDGRLAYKFGLFELADERYREIARSGRSIGDAELQAIGALGLATLAHHRGNYPLSERYHRRAARLAGKSGINRLRHRAHLSLLADATRHKQFDRALIEAWHMMQVSDDDDTARASDLQCLAEVLIHMGEVDTARAILSQVLRKPLPGSVLLPALGGYATASARAGDPSGVDWVVSQLAHLAEAMTSRFLYAQLAVECAEALAIVQRPAEAERWRARGLELARLHRFHELAFRAESLAVHRPIEQVRVARRHTADVTRVLRSVRDIEAARLPARARLAPAGAT
jgi:tetratricopeptide (TPR) repeat protein